MTTDKEKSKHVIVEIIRQAGGTLRNKTILFKAFYHAHLEYAAKNPGYLTTWPIVKMPHGPGIDNANVLLGELMAEGVLDVTQIQEGRFTAFMFEFTGEPPPGSPLSKEANEAIKSGLAVVTGKTASEVSDESHESSRSWRSARDGEELNIYLDLGSDQEFAARDEGIRKIASELRSVW